MSTFPARRHDRRKVTNTDPYMTSEELAAFDLARQQTSLTFHRCENRRRVTGWFPDRKTACRQWDQRKVPIVLRTVTVAPSQLATVERVGTDLAFGLNPGSERPATFEFFTAATFALLANSQPAPTGSRPSIQ